ncbi:hypothetical protein N0V90_001048 [Kalmusia sp. IMI 367209]|nr:hypothetical protein N0V90_001048 [Kalmusia sp. IMI 367209]
MLRLDSLPYSLVHRATVAGVLTRHKAHQSYTTHASKHGRHRICPGLPLSIYVLLFNLTIQDDNDGNASVVSFHDEIDDVEDDFTVRPVDEGHELTFVVEDNGKLLPVDDIGPLSDDAASLQGYDDYAAGSDYGRPAKRTKPAHFDKTIRRAERSAKRISIEQSNNFFIDDDNGVPYTAPSRVAGTFGRRNREKGSTLPAYHKKVSHDLDSDDELMMAMREKGLPIGLQRKAGSNMIPRAYRLASSASSKSQADRSDWELKNGHKEWTLQDDRLLLRAYDLADIEIAYEIERLRAWRFKKAAEWMRRINKESVFSAKACHERYSALLDGTAAIPCDQDDNPDARHAAMAQFRDEREATREQKQAEKDHKEAEIQRIKEEAQARQAKKAAETATKRAIEANEKANRSMQRAAAAQLKYQQAEENKKKKAETAAAKEAKKAASAREKKFKEDFKLSNFKHVTESTPDPRAGLALTDLRRLCAARKLDIMGRNDALLQRLRDADDMLKSRQLIDMCKAKGVPTGGTKIQMKYQLALAAAHECASYSPDDDEMEESEEVADGGDEAEAEDVDIDMGMSMPGY